MSSQITSIFNEKSKDPTKEIIIECLADIVKLKASDISTDNFENKFADIAFDRIDETSDFTGVKAILKIEYEKDEDGAKDILKIMDEINLDDPERRANICEIKEKCQFESTFVELPQEEYYKIFKIPSFKDHIILDTGPTCLLFSDEISITTSTGTLNNYQEHVSTRVIVRSVSTSLESASILSKDESDISENLSGKHPAFLNYYGNYKNSETEEPELNSSLNIVMELCS